MPVGAANEDSDDRCGWMPGIPACPYLPPVVLVLKAESMSPHRGQRGPEYYEAALAYGQSLWLQGKPAQAILQLNKAWMARLDGSEAVLRRWPVPFRALWWMLLHVPGGTFLGNPVRHFQHLATRVSGDNREPRSWRAWACFHLSRRLLPTDGFPPDEEQIERESLVIPSPEQVITALDRCGWAGEADHFRELMGEVGPP